jgi:hypothetical protein
VKAALDPVAYSCGRLEVEDAVLQGERPERFEPDAEDIVGDLTTQAFLDPRPGVIELIVR